MRKERIRLLYLDDEVNNLNAFKASFRRDYEIYTAENTLEARKLLQHLDLHIILADQRMPGTTGVEFFNMIKDKYPDPIRILLTGYADVKSLIDAINKGQIYRFIRKPWDEFEIQNAISNAYEIYCTKKELNEKMEQLEKANDELSRFIYSASHDLRSPLMSVLGIINLARMEQSVQDPNGYFSMIESSIHRLDGFIQKLVEYYKNVKQQTIYEKVDFYGLIQNCIKQAEYEDASFRIIEEVYQHSEFYSDPFRIHIIISNLISNAIKYQNPEVNDPFVKILVVSDTQKAKLIIEDNGIGILTEHLNNIFKMFFRSGNDRKSGTGMGLYIVKEALTRIGGNITASSLPGKGTKFNIMIPNQHEDRE